jgi:Divergent InlB B-repeat domain
VRGIAAAGALVATVACALTAATGAAHPGVDALRRSSTVEPAATAAPSAAAAWCGSAATADRAPNVVAGNPIHWIYLIPSDGGDNLGSVAPVMQSDAEQIDVWWRGQDSTRAPRNDIATFSCGTQLDITTVRSTLSSAQLTPLDNRFTLIFQTLSQAGFTSQFTKYVVYYDGSAAEDNVCGQGGSNSVNGFGLAVVFYRSCVGISTAAVAAHEFLHTTGAVPNGTPHACTGETSGHTCDSSADLMYPFIGQGGLSAKVLDPGRDDYYGHSGAWTDSQDSSWLVRLDGQAPLPLTMSGTGSVAADVPGLTCSASCTTTWNNGQQVLLTATPAAGAKLVRWGGACSGSGTCSVTVGPGVAVSALFAQASFRLTVRVAGSGSVRSSGGIQCRPRCSATLPSYQPARLAATPAKGWKLRSWSGACKGAKKTCTVPMSAVTSVRATFVRR